MSTRKAITPRGELHHVNLPFILANPVSRPSPINRRPLLVVSHRMSF
jgi:hypothetical protein